MIFDIDFESQYFAIFTARFLIGRSSAKDLLQWESAIYHSIKLGFEGQAAKIFLNGIYYIHTHIIYQAAKGWAFALKA